MYVCQLLQLIKLATPRLHSTSLWPFWFCLLTKSQILAYLWRLEAGFCDTGLGLIPSGICGRQSDNGYFSTDTFSYHPPIITAPMLHTHLRSGPGKVFSLCDSGFKVLIQCMLFQSLIVKQFELQGYIDVNFLQYASCNSNTRLHIAPSLLNISDCACK
jgi:hypothetical protein